MLDCDAVVIGSGAGGLTAGLALARAGQRVQILEQHYLPGGWCHTFGLGGYRFSPGVHYLGGLREGGDLRATWEGLGLGGDLTLLELNPAAYDQVRIGERRFDWAAGTERRADTLAAQLPAEADGVRGYLADMTQMGRGLQRLMAARRPIDAAKVLARHPALARWGLRPLSHLLHHHVSDPVARAALAVQVGDTGLPPSRMNAALHAAVLHHYEDGAWYPLGGGGSIPRAYAKALKAEGGKLRVKTEVAEILTEPGASGKRRAVGVRLADGATLRADTVISNADPAVTFGRLLDPGALSDRLRRKVDRTRWSITALSLFMAAELDPADYGLDSGNVWEMRAPDLEAAYRGPGQPLHTVESFGSLFLTVTSAKDRTKVKGGVHTLEAFTLLPYAPFAPWAGTATGERPESYHQLKAHLQEAMIRSVARVIPDIADRLRFVELGTPLSNDFYCRSTRGSLYGTEKSLTQLGPLGYGLGVDEIDGLYLCGASTLAHGVAGATMTGLLAAAQATGTRPKELLRHQGPALRLLPADDPQVWPDDLRKKAERAARGAP